MIYGGSNIANGTYKPITAEQEKFIRNNIEILTVKEMASSLSVSTTKITNWLTELKIDRKKRIIRDREKKEISVKEGFYNPSANSFF